MEKQVSAFANMLYYLILGLVLAGLLWAYFLPIELTVPGQGYVSFLGEPYAISASQNGKADTLYFKSATEVKRGEKVLTYYVSDEINSLKQVDVAAPTEGVILWQRDLVKGDMIRAGERLALIYPSSPVGIKLYLQEQDLGRVQPGMPVRIKLNAYPYQSFGVIRGVVEELVLQNEVIPGRELQLAVLVSIEEIPDSQIKLRPGLAAQAEIITGKSNLLQRLIF